MTSIKNYIIDTAVALLYYNYLCELQSSITCNIFVLFPIKLSPYNYERLEVVLKIIQAADENVATFSVCQVRSNTSSYT